MAFDWLHCMKQKPLDIQEPVIVDATAFEDALALMLIGSVPIRGSVLSEAHDLLKYPSGNDASNGEARRGEAKRSEGKVA